jgi:hypothetical protein
LEARLVSSAEAAQQAWSSPGALLVMPFVDGRQARRAAALMSARAGADGLLLAVHDDRREGFIRVANRVFLGSDSSYFGYVAQDAFPGRYWLRRALALFARPSVQLVAFNDGKWFGALAAYGLARRAWAAQNYGGPLFFPLYRRHYADAELSVLAASDGGLGYSADSVLVEADWDKDRKPVDEGDRRLFRARASARFEGRLRPGACVSHFW